MSSMFDYLKASVAEIARLRREASEQGLEMPDAVRQRVVAMRHQLLEAGVSQQQIDATPGLEPPD